ncbi:hypothetical protein Tco_0967931 [Tanacetum coccineum]
MTTPWRILVPEETLDKCHTMLEEPVSTRKVACLLTIDMMWTFWVNKAFWSLVAADLSFSVRFGQSDCRSTQSNSVASVFRVDTGGTYGRAGAGLDTSPELMGQRTNRLGAGPGLDYVQEPFAQSAHRIERE